MPTYEIIEKHNSNKRSIYTKNVVKLIKFRETNLARIYRSKDARHWKIKFREWIFCLLKSVLL